MIKKIAGYYSIVLGILIAGLWIMLYYTNNIPELKNEQFQITMHVISEIITALLLIFAGFGLLFNNKYSRRMFYVACGMVVYSVLNAAGYYGQQNNTAMALIFLAILIVTSVLLILVIRKK